MKYRTIVADPPWPHDGFYSAGRGGIVSAPYPTMSVEDISALPVKELAVTDHWGAQRAELRAAGLPTVDGSHLYLWTTQMFLWDAREVVDAWGFKPVCVLAWCKPPTGAGVGSGSYRTSLEFVLFCTRGKPTGSGCVDRQWFEWRRGPHSAKPEAFFDIVEQVSRGPYLELFARRQRLGWDTWGNEALCHVEMGASPCDQRSTS